MIYEDDYNLAEELSLAAKNSGCRLQRKPYCKANSDLPAALAIAVEINRARREKERSK